MKKMLIKKLALFALIAVIAGGFLFNGEVFASTYNEGELIIKINTDDQYAAEIAAMKADLEVYETRVLENRVVILGGYRTTWSVQYWLFASKMTVSQTVSTYTGRSYIAYIEPNYLIYYYGSPNDTHFADQWAINNTGQSGGKTDADIDAPEAWDFAAGKSAEEITVAVVDTGVDASHADLRGRMSDSGRDFVNNDRDPDDDNGHGTHIAGIIAAVRNNGIGIAGVCDTAKIMSLKFLDENGQGDVADAFAALKYAREQGAKVVNLSWSIGADRSYSLEEAIEAGRKKGQLFIAAAGNSGGNNDVNPEYPASYESDNIISVAATDHNDELSDHAGWSSNYGAVSVDLAAPGSDIYSTLPGNTYGTEGGTSMAAAYVSGVVSLLWSLEPNLTYREVKQRILNGADRLPALAGKTVSGGRLNAYKTVKGFSSGSNWPMFRNDPRHTGISPNIGPQSETVKWVSQLSEKEIYSSPAIDEDGTLYVGSSDGNLYAVRPDGTVKWKYLTAGRITSSPAVASDGTIYVGSEDYSVYAIRPDGTLKWYYRTGREVISGATVGNDGTVYIGSYDGHLYAFNPDGTLKYKCPAGGAIHTTPALGADGVVYTGTCNFNKLVAINPNGTLKWESGLHSNVLKSSPSLSADGKTVFYGADDSFFYARNTTDGTLKWKAGPSYGGFQGSPAIGADGTVYVGTQYGNLLAFNAENGVLKWNYYMTLSVFSSPAIGADSTIYFSTAYGTLYAMNPDGTVKWKYSGGFGEAGHFYSSPAIGADGTLYIGSTNGKLFAFGDSADADADGLPDVWERAHFGDLSEDGAGDDDNDGLTNLQELELETDPANSDSDDDGWDDYQEYNAGTNPKNSDSYIDAYTVCPGDSVSIPVFLNNVEAAGIESIDAKLTYNGDVLVAKDATLTGGILEKGDYGLTYQIEDGNISLSVFAKGDLATATGKVFFINFYVTGEVGDTAELVFKKAKLNESVIVTENIPVAVAECPDAYEISGTVRYFGDDSYMSDVLLELNGSSSGSENTGTDGKYAFFVPRIPADYTVTPYKNNEFGGLSGMDASRIAKFAAGFPDIVFDRYQKIAADVNRDGEINGLDASRVARYVAGKINYLNGDDTHWVFVTASLESRIFAPPRSYSSQYIYSPLNSDKRNQDFIAIRIGDVTGNWAQEPVREKRDIRSAAYKVSVGAGDTLTVPIVLDQETAIEGIDIAFDFDADVLKISGATLSGGILENRGYALLVNTDTPGKAKLVVSANADTVTNIGETVFIRFEVVGNSGASGELSLTGFDCNETPAQGGFRFNRKLCQTAEVRVK